ncbi:MAG: hypothetical protein ABI197_08995 [Granulicella sp.]
MSAPGNVDQIGDGRVAPHDFSRFFNTCYQDQTGKPVVSVVNAGTGSYSVRGCEALSPATNPTYRQRYSYTFQNNSPYIGYRQRIYPLEDVSLFKQFILREGVSFEIRGEFFNVGNRPNFGGPGTGLNSSTYGFVTLTQANDARIGQLTGRINF